MVTVARVLPYALNIQHYSAPPPLYPVIPPPVADEHVDNTCSWVHSSVFVGPLFRHTHTHANTHKRHTTRTHAHAHLLSAVLVGISSVLYWAAKRYSYRCTSPEGTCGLRLKTADRT